MAEPTSSTFAIAIQAIGGAALIGALTGLDYWTLLGGVTGALMALRSQDPQGPLRAVAGIVGVAMVSLFATWFLVETLPAVAQAFGAGDFPTLGKGRVILAFVVGYYGRSVILPSGGRLISNWFARLGGQPAPGGEGNKP